MFKKMIAAGLAMGALSVLLLSAAEPSKTPSEGDGLASKYLGDQGISKHPAVVFVEDFEYAELSALNGRWSAVSNKADALFLDEKINLDGSPGKKSLKISALKGKNEGGLLNKVFKPGYEELFVRLYVRFDEGYGFNHHFCKLGGELNPSNYPAGRAGQKGDTWFLTGLEPTSSLQHNWPPKDFAPPGYWSFYTYYPEMHSWQTPEGTPDGKPNAYYGNRFASENPPLVERGKWICLEWSIKLNSAADKRDGAQRFWIDGKLMGNWEPGSPMGYWMRENFRIRPDQPEKQKPFEGFKWRDNMELKLNVFRIENYVSENSFKQIATYKAAHPDFNIDTEKAVVWVDHVVVATEYIGPMAVKK